MQDLLRGNVWLLRGRTDARRLVQELEQQHSRRQQVPCEQEAYSIDNMLRTSVRNIRLVHIGVGGLFSKHVWFRRHAVAARGVQDLGRRHRRKLQVRRGHEALHLDVLLHSHMLHSHIVISDATPNTAPARL